MLFTLTMVVLLATIMVFFSQEFSKALKKITAIPGVLLFVPLFVASCLVEYYQQWGIWLLLVLQEGFQDVVNFMVMLIPFMENSIWVVRIFLLFFISCLPIWVSFVIQKTKKIPDSDLDLRLMSLFTWILVAMLIIAYP